MVGLDWTGHMSFLTRQDRTPKFAGPDWIWTYIFKHFAYQVRVINSHKIRSLDLVSKVKEEKKSWFFFFSNLLNFLYSFSIIILLLKVRRPGRKKSGFRTARTLRICRISGPDLMSGRALMCNMHCAVSIPSSHNHLLKIHALTAQCWLCAWNCPKIWCFFAI